MKYFAGINSPGFKPMLRNIQNPLNVESLPVLPVDTFMVFDVPDISIRFNLASSVEFFDNQYVLTWTQGPNEGLPGNHIIYSTSPDGQTWSAPQNVIPVTPDVWVAGAASLWPRDDELWVVYKHSEQGDASEGLGYYGPSLATFGSRWNGSGWGVPYSAYRKWDFNDGLEGWTGVNGTVSAANGVLTFQPTAGDARILAGGNFHVNGTIFTSVRMRIRRTVGTGEIAQRQLYFTVNGGIDTAGSVPSPEDPSQWNIMEWDCSGITGWTNGSPTNIRIDLGLAGDVFEIDWIEIGGTVSQVICENCLLDKEPIRLPNGQWHGFGRDRDFIAQMITGDVGNWTRTIVPSPEGTLLNEPTAILSADNRFICYEFRNEEDMNPRVLLRSFSYDGGRTISPPKPTNFPDAKSNRDVLRLSDGRYVLCSNASEAENRKKLMLSVSDNGLEYDRVYILRGEPTAPKWGTPDLPRTGYQYPQMMEKDGFLWVTYSRNKEDIQISRIALSAFT